MSEREEYFESARSWADTQSGSLLRERKMAWIIAGVATVIALILAFLATLYPSWHASKVNPAEALRYE